MEEPSSGLNVTLPTSPKGLRHTFTFLTAYLGITSYYSWPVKDVVQETFLIVPLRAIPIKRSFEVIFKVPLNAMVGKIREDFGSMGLPTEEMKVYKRIAGY